MGEIARSSAARRGLFVALVLGLAAGGVEALAPKKSDDLLRRKQFSRLDLRVSGANVPLAEVIDRLPNRAAWTAFAGTRAADGSKFLVFVDPRSGVATNITGAVPLIPGSGVGNGIKLATLGERLGRPVERVDAAAVRDATLAFISDRQQVLGVDTTQLGVARATPVTADLWQVYIAQQYRGIPVRHGHVAASISHGNLVTIGAPGWDNVRLPDVTPSIAAEAAVDAGFAYAEGRTSGDEIESAPALEIVPFAPAEKQTGAAAVPIGEGYGHRLVWTFVFRRSGEAARWQVVVDAHSGEVLSLQDLNRYTHRHIDGGVYPLTNTEVCPDNQTCGTMQYDVPMPFANTGQPAPNDFTNGAGVYDYTSGAASTTLSGRYFGVNFNYIENGVSSESSPDGTINLRGLNGQHDLTSSGASTGDTAAARTAFYELNKIAEMARGYLPLNAFLGGEPLAVFVNDNDTCNAYYDSGVRGTFNPPVPPSVHFFRSGQSAFDPGTTCRNTGESAAALDHEWGHWLDDHDANFRETGEEYADIAALYRTQSSCLSHGFFVTNSDGCGPTADGLGFNVNMTADGSPHCATNCSGVREADWAKHVPNTPDDAFHFVFNHCPFDPNDINGKGVDPHCVAAPVDQMAWDLVTRDLTAAPFNMNSQDAFIVGNKLFYQGSGNVYDWFHWWSWIFPPDGCSVDNGYMQWLTADDDNGNLNDGTPHMTAIYNAYDRHGIACQDIPRVNSGCSAGPSASPAVTATPGGDRITLNWTAIPGATRYWVFRTEGHAGCDYGKALIAEVAGLTYTDTEVTAARPYSYNVVAAGASSACFGRASTCATATPDIQGYTIACSPSSVIDGATSSCSVTSHSDYASPVTLGCVEMPGTASCSFTPASITPPANGTAVSTLRVNSGVTPPGTYTVGVRGNPPSSAGHENAATVNWTLSGTSSLATFDGRFNAPSCRSASRSCDTGASLIRGRGTLSPETNTPNTGHTLLQPVCTDGNGTLFPNTPPYGSVDRVMVYTQDGTIFAPGKRVRVDATVEARRDFTNDRVDLFATTDASGTGWTRIGTLVPTRAGSQVLSFTYTLGPGQVQAVRVQLRYQGTATPCLAGPYNDRDDLVFAVGS